MAMTNRPRIAFLTPQAPLSRKTWSGTTFSMYCTLQMHCGEVTPLGPAPVGQLGGKLFNRAVRLFGKRYDYSHGIAYARKCSQFFEKELHGKQFDFIFAPAASSGLAFLNTDIPIIYASDATFALLQDYYPQFTNLLSISVRQGNEIEQAALNRSRLALFSSEWAARSAIETYGVPSDQVAIIPFGANMQAILPRCALLKRNYSGRLKLLFLAVDWSRKGGDIAFETLVTLLERGVDAELVVCGCIPPAGVSHKRMTVIPFLNKDDPTQMKTLVDLFLSTKFLLLPTRYDCTPVVICEANAFGIPVVTADTGGVSSLIKNGENGVALPSTARGNQYAGMIFDLYRDAERYQELCASSRAFYERRLNWNSWAIEVGNLLAEVGSTTHQSRHAVGW